jgi:hypothetical protein
MARASSGASFLTPASSRGSAGPVNLNCDRAAPPRLGGSPEPLEPRREPLAVGAKLVALRRPAPPNFASLCQGLPGRHCCPQFEHLGYSLSVSKPLLLEPRGPAEEMDAGFHPREIASFTRRSGRHR